MGCDIHVHVEINRGGRWLHWNQPIVARNYHLFGRVAGVRDEDMEPIAPPRGFPEDASETTRLCFELDGSDAHSTTWLTAAEAGQVQEEFEAMFPGKPGQPPLWHYVFGNSVDSHLKYADSRAEFEKLGIQDVRVICWFDN